MNFTDVTANVTVGEWDTWNLNDAVVSYEIYRGNTLIDSFDEEIGDTTGAGLAEAMPSPGSFSSNGNYRIDIEVTFNGSGDDADTVYSLTGSVSLRVSNY